MLATLADMLAAICVPYQTDLPRHFLPTISLQMDFLAPARQGAWVQAQADVLRMTRNLVFTQGLIRADQDIALRVSAIYKIGPLFQDEDAVRGDPFGLLDDRSA
jgi:acyl-coenzyme A thioesterase PaaI-like protein